MSIITRLKGLFSKHTNGEAPDAEAEAPDAAAAALDLEPEVAEGPAVDPATFVYVKVPGDIGPYERGEKYADPLHEALTAAALGEVTGGGSQLDEPNRDGTPRIEFCGVDIHVTRLEPALPFLRDQLRRLAAPLGTQIHYTLDGARLQDELAGNVWVIARPRSEIHPYLGC